eukprot:4080861-Pyramimonas_sp.AAC.1
MLQSSKWTPREKGSMKALACSAVWTKSRARSAGYDQGDVLCELCGGADDTLLHRLWRCPACEDIRSE